MRTQKAISLTERMEAFKLGTQDTARSRIYPATHPGLRYTSNWFGRSEPNPWYISEEDRRRWPAVQGEKLTEEYQTAYNEAKETNEARYQEILAGYKTRYSTAMESLATSRSEVLSGLKGLGEEELAGIGRRYTKERASTAQQLISSGLHSTTVAPAVQAGVTRREGYAMGEARERHRRERLGYLSQLSDRELQMQTGLSREELEFMERREDEYPSESLYVQLMQGLGSS